jgi:hypothetical protein
VFFSYLKIVLDLQSVSCSPYDVLTKFKTCSFVVVNQSTISSIFAQKKNYESKFNVDCFEDENSGKTKFVELEKDDYFFIATMINQLFIISAIFAQKRI